MQIIRPMIRDTSTQVCGGEENHTPQLRSGDESKQRRRRKVGASCSQEVVSYVQGSGRAAHARD